MRAIGKCMCVCVCVLCEVNGTRWRRSGLSGGLQFLGNTCLSSPAPLHACVHVCVCNPRAYLATAHMTLSCYCKTARSVTHHLLRIQGASGKAHHIRSQISMGATLDLKICSIHFTQGCSGHLESQKRVGWGFLEGVDVGDMAMRGAGLAKAEKGC